MTPNSPNGAIDTKASSSNVFFQHPSNNTNAIIKVHVVLSVFFFPYRCTSYYSYTFSSISFICDYSQLAGRTCLYMEISSIELVGTLPFHFDLLPIIMPRTYLLVRSTPVIMDWSKMALIVPLKLLQLVLQ